MRNIYRTAQRTAVWLGEATSNIASPVTFGCVPATAGREEPADVRP
jgi:hypothetical protein